VERAPRVLKTVSEVYTWTTVLGRRASLPLVLAPTGFTRMMQHQGELAVARAAAAGGRPVHAVHHGHHVAGGRGGGCAAGAQLVPALPVEGPRSRARRGRRPLLRFCLDWSEQRHHLGGTLGASVLASFEQSDWVTRRNGDRAVTLTKLGEQELGQRLGLKFSCPGQSLPAGRSRCGTGPDGWGAAAAAPLSTRHDEAVIKRRSVSSGARGSLSSATRGRCVSASGCRSPARQQQRRAAARSGETTSGSRRARRCAASSSRSSRRARGWRTSCGPACS